MTESNAIENLYVEEKKYTAEEIAQSKQKLIVKNKLARKKKRL